MRKMILLAIASFLWKQVKLRRGRAQAGRAMQRRRY